MKLAVIIIKSVTVIGIALFLFCIILYAHLNQQGKVIEKQKVEFNEVEQEKLEKLVEIQNR